MSNVRNYRKEILSCLVPYFRQDERYHLLVCDMGFGAIDQIKQEFPHRIVNAGIMEQGTVGIAAGMSISGLIPIVYSIVNFLVFRALEQVRNDVILQNANVKFIGTGVNDYFRFLGPSHCCGREDVAIMELINMKVYDPYTSTKSFYELVREWVRDENPGYIRV